MNRKVILAETPNGIPQSRHFSIVESSSPELPTDGFLVENQFLSVEPAMRGWLSDKGNYSKPILVGDVMRAIAAGRIVASNNPKYPVGTAVSGWFGWQDVAAATEAEVIRVIKEDDLPLSLSLGILGLTGMAAYLGLTCAGAPVAGDILGGVGTEMDIIHDVAHDHLAAGRPDPSARCVAREPLEV